MPTSPTAIPVYLEVGAKRVFAGALDWPGWCLSGRDAEAALQALVAAGPRYSELMKGARLGFKAPKTVAALKVVERLKGNGATDFGAPYFAPQADARLATAADLRRFEKFIHAGWAGLAGAAQAAEGHALRKGPRGGGRELAEIIRHVLDAQASYLASFGWKYKRDEQLPPPAAMVELEAAMLAGLAASVKGEIPAISQRGGKRWSPRYFVRRSLWHIVDHVWEIEKRLWPV